MFYRLLPFLLLSTLAFSPSAQAAQVLLNYYFGNQNVGSYIKIYTDGEIEHIERECCPPRKIIPLNPRLSENEIDALKMLILAAADGPFIEKEAKNSEQYYGFFKVFHNRREIVIRDFPTPLGSKKAKLNTSDAASELVQFIVRFAQVKIPEVSYEIIR